RPHVRRAICQSLAAVPGRLRNRISCRNASALPDRLRAACSQSPPLDARLSLRTRRHATTGAGMDSCDILIVGGGPAGSACAWKLRSAGLDVLVLDKRKFP